MKRVKYSKYIPNLAEEVSLDDLMEALSDFLLESGFEDELGRLHQSGAGDDALDALREAIREALLNSDLFDENMRQQMSQLQGEGQMEELIGEVIGRMQEEGFVTISPPHEPTQLSTTGGSVG
jgi:Ca-activated chloride channel family protein